MTSYDDHAGKDQPLVGFHLPFALWSSSLTPGQSSPSGLSREPRRIGKPPGVPEVDRTGREGDLTSLLGIRPGRARGCDDQGPAPAVSCCAGSSSRVVAARGGSAKPRTHFSDAFVSYFPA